MTSLDVRSPGLSADSTYLDRLRAPQVGELLRPEEAEQYPRGVASAVLLSLEGIRAGADTGVAVAVMELMAVLSPNGVRRTMIHAAGQQGALGGDGQAGELGADVADRALARLAGVSLLTVSIDGSAVTAHRLVTRVIREQATSRSALAGVCTAAAGLLGELAGPLDRGWHEWNGPWSATWWSRSWPCMGHRFPARTTAT